MPKPRLLVSLAAAFVAATAVVAHAAEKPHLVHVKGPEGYRPTSASYFQEGVVNVEYYRESDHDRREGFIDRAGEFRLDLGESKDFWAF